MTVKKLLLLVFLCVYLSKANAKDYFDELKTWYQDIKSAHYDACKDHISPESLQELDDNLEADNEEIRAWTNCLLIKHGFITNSEIDLEKIVQEAKKFIPDMDEKEETSARNYLNICKTDAEKCENDIDTAGTFANCVMDRTITGL